MIYITRFRIKESVQPTETAEVHKLFDTKIIPAVEGVEGVRSAQVFQSFNGELVALIEMDNLATVDRILVDEGCRAVFGELGKHTMRTGGEVLYDRPAWQALYSS